ncbi:MAG: rRNA maturation RNase YbeY [Calditrichaeota bacterium]|nr:rRNA maturation RNase YbeY [Calditrichota bacterium]
MKLRIKVFKNKYRLPIKRQEVVKIIETVVGGESPGLEGEISVIFLPNDSIRELNRSFLNHDYPTDVIAFNLEENPGKTVEGEVYIGFERAREQAREFGVSYRNELHRLVIHGVLHLLGWEDDSPEKKQKMTARENDYLAKLLNE